MSTKRNGRWVLAGQIQIESAQVLICDCGEIFHHLEELKKEASNLTYNDYLAKPIADYRGVISSTGWGDGLYDVEVFIYDGGTLGKRVMELRIRFIDIEDEDDMADEDETDDSKIVDMNLLRTGHWDSNSDPENTGGLKITK